MELCDIRVLYGYRGDRKGLWVDHKCQDIMLIGFSVRYGVTHITTSDGMNVRTEPIEGFKKRINYEANRRNDSTC